MCPFTSGCTVRTRAQERWTHAWDLLGTGATHTAMSPLKWAQQEGEAVTGTSSLILASDPYY